MPARSTIDQIAVRYRPADSATGVTRSTAKGLAEQLGVDETQVIHLALHEMAVKLLPQYEADDAPLTATADQEAGTSGQEAIGAFEPVRSDAGITPP